VCVPALLGTMCPPPCVHQLTAPDLQPAAVTQFAVLPVLLAAVMAEQPSRVIQKSREFVPFSRVVICGAKFALL
jgi:hypothetical protein